MSFFARLQHLLLLLPFVAATAASAQQTRHVPSDLPTIQAAIDASSTGDTILVAPGTYPGRLVLSGKEITLTSSGGPSVTFLDGSSSGTVLTISNTPSLRTTVSGFTIQHGFTLIGPAAAAGILLQNAGATVSGNIFLHNTGADLTVSNGSINALSNTLSTAPTSTCFSPSLPYGNAGIILVGPTSLLDSTSTPIPSALVGNTVLGDGTSCSGIAVTLSSHTEPILLWNNTLRNSYTALVADSLTSLTLFQNLIYDNTNGAIALSDNTTPSPETEPPTLHLSNNTIVNNSTSNISGTSPEIALSDVAGRTEFVNNILVGTTGTHPVLGCTSTNAGSSPWPLILDHNDLFNTTRAPGGLIAPSCTSVLGPDPLSQLSQNGNLSADPQLTGSTDLHPLPNSPVLDAGTNSAPRLVLPPAAPDPSLTPLLSQDIAGNPRLSNSTGQPYAIVDLGAYERPGMNAGYSTALDLTPSGATSLTATLHVPPSTITPAGTVTFFVNGQSVGSSSITAVDRSTGTATLSFAVPTSGWAALTASVVAYAADPSTSVVRYAGLSSTPAPATTTLTLSASPSTQTLNQPITLTSQLGSTTASNTPGPIPPGALSLSQDGTFLSNLQPNSSGLSTYTITFTYTPDPAFSPTSTTRTVTVGGQATVTTLAVTPNPSPLTTTPVLSSSVHYIANTPGLPTGTLSIYDGNTLLFSTPYPVNNGNVSFPQTFTTAGPHHLSAVFTPATAADLTSAAATDLTLSAAPALVTTLSVSSPSVAFGDPFTLTSSISPPSAIPTGTTLSVYDNGVLRYTATVNSGAFSAILTFSGPNTTVGSHQFYETLTSTQGTLLSTSNSVPLQVTSVPVTLALSTSPASSTNALSPVTLSAALTTPPAYTGITPSGSVTFFDGIIPLGTSAISSTGLATLALPSLTPGNHTLSAYYTGNAQIPSASSGPLSFTVLPNPTSTTLTLTPTGTAGAFTTLTLSAHVSTCTAPCQTAAVTFFSGSSALLQALPDASGNATATLHLPAGSYTFTASYAGNLLFNTSTSAAVPLTITPNPGTLTLASTATTVQQNAAVTLGALFTPGVTLPGVHPTGTVTLTDSLGSPASTPLLSGPNQLTGSATLTFTPTAVGTHTLTVTYSGDTNNLPASASLTVNVTAPPPVVTPPPPSQDFRISLSTAAITLQSTHHTSMQVTLSTTGGLSDTIHLSCANLPSNASCTFTPATLRVGQNTTNNPAAATYTSTVSVDTDFILNWAHTAAPSTPGSNPTLPLLALTLPTTALLFLRRRRLPHLLALLLLTAAATLPLTACGNKDPGHTDPGTYSIQVTGHADTMSADRSAPFTLTVTR